MNFEDREVSDVMMRFLENKFKNGKASENKIDNILHTHLDSFWKGERSIYEYAFKSRKVPKKEFRKTEKHTSIHPKILFAGAALVLAVSLFISLRSWGKEFFRRTFYPPELFNNGSTTVNSQQLYTYNATYRLMILDEYGFWEEDPLNIFSFSSENETYGDNFLDLSESDWLNSML